jgi:hypothetical protein
MYNLGPLPSDFQDIRLYDSLIAVSDLPWLGVASREGG